MPFQRGPPEALVVGEKGGQDPGYVVQAQARVPQTAQHHGGTELDVRVVPVAAPRIDLAGAQEAQAVVVPQHPGAQARHTGELADGPTRSDGCLGHAFTFRVVTVARSTGSSCPGTTGAAPERPWHPLSASAGPCGVSRSDRARSVPARSVSGRPVPRRCESPARGRTHHPAVVSRSTRSYPSAHGRTLKPPQGTTRRRRVRLREPTYDRASSG